MNNQFQSRTRHRTRQTAGLLTLLLLTAVVAACAPTALTVTAPPVIVGETFSATGDEPLAARWWQSFADPTLDRLIERALADNFSLQSAWDRLDQAEATARKAGASLIPTLNAEVGGTRSRLRDNGATGSTSSVSLGLVAGYELDLWGAIRSTREAAALDARASAEDLQAAALTLSAQVATAWYQLGERSGQLVLLEEQIATNAQILEVVELQFRTGKAGAADVLQQRQLIEAKRGEVALVEAQVAVLQHQLAILCGATPDQRMTPGTTALADLPPLPRTGVPTELLLRRPDLRSAQTRVLAADQRLAAAMAERFPRLSLGAGLSTSGSQARDLFDNWLTSLSANLITPLIDGGQRRAEVERSRAVTAAALHDYGQTILDALGEVEDALARETQQRSYLASLDSQLALAQLAIERVRDRYFNGAVDYQRLLDAFLSHQQLQRTRLSAQSELIQNRIDLCRALAGGWELERR